MSTLPKDTVKTPNEGEQNLDLPQEEKMEVGINPPPATDPEPQERAEGRELIPSLSGPEERDSTGDEASEILTGLSLQTKRFSGTRRKRLSRLLKSGIPYETALRMILEEVGPARSSEGEQQTSSGRIGGEKRPRSDGSSPELRAKKPREGGGQVKPSFGAVAGGIRVGIIHSDYPGTAMTNEQLGALQRAILKSVEQIPEDGPQVRFLGCTYRPGWLLITCADQESVSWLEGVMIRLRPWEGAHLKMVQGEDIPKPHVFVAYIPDDVGHRLTSEEVLLRLRKMNRSLDTREWKILHREESKPGQTWTFSVDEMSKSALEELSYRPYFGFGQVQFRPKNKAERRKNPPPQGTLVVAPGTKAGGPKPPPKPGKRPQVTKGGRGKSLPQKPSGKGKYPTNKPPLKKGASGKGKPLPEKSFFLKAGAKEAPAKGKETTSRGGESSHPTSLPPPPPPPPPPEFS